MVREQADWKKVLGRQFEIRPSPWNLGIDCSPPETHKTRNGNVFAATNFVNPRVRTSFLWFIISRPGVSTALQFRLCCSPWHHSPVSSRFGRWRCALPCCEAYWASCACYDLLDRVHKCLCGLTNILVNLSTGLKWLDHQEWSL